MLRNCTIIIFAAASLTYCGEKQPKRPSRSAVIDNNSNENDANKMDVAPACNINLSPSKVLPGDKLKVIMTTTGKVHYAEIEGREIDKTGGELEFVSDKTKTSYVGRVESEDETLIVCSSKVSFIEDTDNDNPDVPIPGPNPIPAPTVTSSSTITTSQTPTWTWTSNSSLLPKKYQYRIDNEPYVSTFNESFTPNFLPYGTRTLYVRELGNDGEASPDASFAITISPSLPACSTGGVRLNPNDPYCWYSSDKNHVIAGGGSCEAICSTRGGYNEATKTIAGSAGTNSACYDVAFKLMNPRTFASTTATESTATYGCAYNFDGGGKILLYRGKGATTSSGGFSGAWRLCACNN